MSTTAGLGVNCPAKAQRDFEARWEAAEQTGAELLDSWA